MRRTVREIAELVNGEVVGDDSVIITGVAGIREAREGDITFLANPKYFPFLETTRASAVVAAFDPSTHAPALAGGMCGSTGSPSLEPSRAQSRDSGCRPEGAKESGAPGLPGGFHGPAASKPIIRTENPSLAFSKIAALLNPTDIVRPQGIHPTAVIGRNARLGAGTALGPYVVIEDDVAIGDNSIVYAGVFIGHHTTIGGGCLIYANVSIREYTVIGGRVIIHSGAVIGADGFGFVTINGEHHKIPQTGSVEIGDDVEIGANVTIDRARFDRTVIGSGAKIDNLVQIAHNVVIGENSIIVAQAGISGSTTVGRNVIIAGQAGLVGHISVGDEAVITAQSGVSKSVPARAVVSGSPARAHAQSNKIMAYMQQLPRLCDEVRELRKKVARLEEGQRGEAAHDTP